ncbi:MAG: hypothetical protein ACR2G7_11385 [Acidimicrobiales bacterium]
MAAALLANGQPEGAEDCLARALIETRVLQAELAIARDDPAADSLLEAASAMVQPSGNSISFNVPDLTWLG